MGHTPTTCRSSTSSISSLEVKARTYSLEAANVRHEHEWRVWQKVKIPEEKI